MFHRRQSLPIIAACTLGLIIAPTVAALHASSHQKLPQLTAVFSHYGQQPAVIFKPTPKVNKVTSATPQPLQATVAEPLLLPKDAAIPSVKYGLAPLIINVETTQKVVFLGIDDGGNKEQSEINLLAQQKVHATLFLADLFVGNKSDFFKGFILTGSLIENHTLNHRQMSHLSYDEQVREICGMADLQEQQFGRRPVLFRPPFGDYNKNTQRAAATCGMKAVVLWVAKANGGSMQYQVGNSLRPGDIVLMHFRPEFAQDLRAFVEAQNAAGLHTELLEDWLPAS